MSETTYTSHTWTDGEIITADLMNHLEQGIASISAAINTAQINYPAINSRVETLETSNTNITNRVDSLESSVSILELNQIGTGGKVTYNEYASEILDDIDESPIIIYNIGKFALLQYNIKLKTVTIPHTYIADISSGYEGKSSDIFTTPGCPLSISGSSIWLEKGTYSSGRIFGTIPYIIDFDMSQGEDSNA